MRVIETKKNELVLIDKDNQVLAVPNTFYFSLKYSQFEGNKISCVLSEKPDMTVCEVKDQEFLCKYNKMKITIQGDKKINELCEILIKNHNTQNTSKYVNFFCRNFAQENQAEILDIFLKPYKSRIKKDSFPQYVIDDLFMVDKWGIVYVKNPNSKPFPWDELKMEVKGNIEEFKIISSFDGQDLIMDADLQILVTKIFYLLGTKKKNDALFMVQLPKKVQRWIEKEDISASINFDIQEEEKSEITVPKVYGYFPTPPLIVEKLLEIANLENGFKILEPSAGQGHILDFLKDYDVTCCEIYFENQAILKEKGFTIACANFMDFEGFDYFDRIIMNPPFYNQADIDHVNHAFRMLKKGGRLVSVMSNSVTFRDNKKSKKFQELVKEFGYFEELPKDSFASSGTKVGTVIVVLDK